MFLTISLRNFLLFLRCEKWQMKLNPFHLSLSVHNAFIKSNDVYKFCTNWLKVRTTTDENDNYRIYNNVKFWVVEESVGVRIQNKYFNFCLASFCHISAYFGYWLRCEISYYRFLRWIYLQYPKKTGNGREKKVTKVQIDITISCICGPKVINRAYHLTIIDDITVKCTLRYEDSI